MSIGPKEVELGIEVILSEEDNAVFVKITGFDNLEDADAYGEYLANNLPLMLFNSEVKH
jgi:hypothetical protein